MRPFASRFARAGAVLFGASLLALACGSQPASEPSAATAQAISTAPDSPAPADFDGDGRADMSLRAADGYWLIDYASNGFGGAWDGVFGGYGAGEAIPVPADYDGDHRADLSVKDSGGVWHVDLSSDGYFGWNYEYGGYGDNSGIPVPADYDGDGRADLSVKGTDGNWYIDYSNSGANVQPPPAMGAFGGWNAIVPNHGVSGFTPYPADFDGDGRADLVVVGPDGTWWFDFSNTPAAPAKPSPGSFGAWNYTLRPAGWAAGSMPCPADFDGDGKADIAFKDPAGVVWVDTSRDGFGSVNQKYGGRGGYWSTPAVADYDGDHYADLSVKDSGAWYVDYAAGGLGAWNVTVQIPQARSWSYPYINDSDPGCNKELLPTSYRQFYANATDPTTTFETWMKNHGCKYGGADVRELVNLPVGSTTLGFSLTICPDTPQFRSELMAMVDATWNGQTASVALGGGPYLTHTAPRTCTTALGPGQIYGIWDPHCPGGCPLIDGDI